MDEDKIRPLLDDLEDAIFGEEEESEEDDGQNLGGFWVLAGYLLGVCWVFAGYLRGIRGVSAGYSRGIRWVFAEILFFFRLNVS